MSVVGIVRRGAGRLVGCQLGFLFFQGTPRLAGGFLLRILLFDGADSVLDGLVSICKICFASRFAWLMMSFFSPFT